MDSKPTVIDFFCGAGGFSEGFRQRGFKILMGIENWQSALNAYNANFGLQCEMKDVLRFEKQEEIERLPDTDIIVGSPPCVLFSNSNKSGKADKALGIKLIETYLRVVAFKKYKARSKLRAWLMENVPNSSKYIKPTYTFGELGLGALARQIGMDPSDVALNTNGHILNAADYGSPQERRRFVCGEIVRNGSFPRPEVIAAKRITLAELRAKIPAPNQKDPKAKFHDPNYPSLVLSAHSITDHFYDSGVYKIDWKIAKESKLNHPFMGRMSFPENESRPSRTVMATRSFRSRESMLFKSEYHREGDGEYRTPTIREIATIMGFPYSYQFSGSESIKWAQVGNAVCPHMSYAIADVIATDIGLRRPKGGIALFRQEPIDDLNTFSKKTFNNPPKRKAYARFRGHPFKGGNITVTLSNYSPYSKTNNKRTKKRWYCSIYQGTGEGFKITPLKRGKYKKVAVIMKHELKDLGIKLIRDFEKEFSHAFGKTKEFQSAYTGARDHNPRLEPSGLIEGIAHFVSQHIDEDHMIELDNKIIKKNKVPARQLCAMYALNRIIS